MLICNSNFDRPHSIVMYEPLLLHVYTITMTISDHIWLSIADIYQSVMMLLLRLITVITSVLVTGKTLLHILPTITDT